MKTTKLSDRWWDWLSASILLIVLLTSATRLYATHWTTFLERAQYLVLLGSVLGLALGQSSFSPRLVKWMALGYSIFVIPWQLGSTMDASLPWTDRLHLLGFRINLAGSEFLSSKAVHDPILFLTLMCILFWVIGLVSGYFLTRYGQPWQAILPAGIALIVVNHYDPALSSWSRYLGIFLFFSLLLLGRLTFLHYRSEWQASGVMASPGTGADMGRAALMAVVVLVLFAWTAPAIGASLSPASRLWVQVSKPWDKLRNRVSGAFSSLQSSVGVVSDFYGDTMALGSGTRLGDDIVFTVHSSVSQQPGFQFYWWARSYDRYDGQWSSTITAKKSFDAASFKIAYPEWTARQEVKFTFNSHVTLLSNFYGPPVPISLDHSGAATMAVNPDGSDDISLLSADPPLHVGDRYTITGWVNDPTIAQLRASNTEYPRWVKDRYLQVPNNLSNKFETLAKRITEGLDNPYDKTEAITQYLRRTITYKDTFPTPPPGVDPAEYFLFTVKQGYCNYYATAEVLLLRSIGIPARMSVGFAQGDGSQSNPNIPGEGGQYPDTFLVRYKDSHAWPDVFFNGIGWVEFEPTVSQPNRELLSGSDNPADQQSTIDRHLGDSARLDALGMDTPGNTFDPTLTTQTQRTTTARVILGGSLAALAAAGFVFWRFNHNRIQLPVVPVWIEANLDKRGIATPGWLRRWARWSVFSPLERAYGVINQALGLLGRPARVSETPAERVTALGTLLPTAREPAEAILTEYQRGQYSRSPADTVRARSASQKVRILAWKEFFKNLFNRRWPDKLFQRSLRSR